MGELTLQRKPLYMNSTVRTDLHMVSGPIWIKLKSYFQGKLFIFRANCHFQGKLLFLGQIISLDAITTFDAITFGWFMKKENYCIIAQSLGNRL